MSHAIPRPQASLQFGKPSRKIGRAADAVKWSKRWCFLGVPRGAPVVESCSLVERGTS